MESYENFFNNSNRWLEALIHKSLNPTLRPGGISKESFKTVKLLNNKIYLKNDNTKSKLAL